MTRLEAAPFHVCAGISGLHSLFDCIHFFNICLESLRDQITLQLSIRGQQTVFNGKRLRADSEPAHLLIMRQFGVDCIQRGLHLGLTNASGNDSRKITAAVAHEHHLRRSGKTSQDIFFNRLGRNVVTGGKDNQVLDPSHNPPIPCLVYFPLISGMEPTVTLCIRSFVRPVDPLAASHLLI